MGADRYLKYVNPVLFLVLLIQVVTGVAMALFEWEAVHELHETNGFILIAVAATHITLNRGWIGRMYFGKK